jgi:DNA invertase Pin-like site-specific DNA recombinase
LRLDVLAAVARKEHEDRRRRQREGIDKAKARGAYRGRPEDVARNQAILKLLKQGNSWSTVMASTGAARATIAKIAKRLQAG